MEQFKTFEGHAYFYSEHIPGFEEDGEVIVETEEI